MYGAIVESPGLTLGIAFATMLVFAPIAAGAQSSPMPGLEAVWMPPRVSRDDARWRLEDLACDGCTLVGLEHMQQLLRDPANDQRPISELMEAVEALEENYVDSILTPSAKEQLKAFDPTADATIDCTPDGDGLQHQITAPLPLEIERHDGEIVFHYEYWNAIRRVQMGEGHRPADVEPTRLGYSTGRFEDSTLVVETTDLIPNMVSLPGGAIRLSSKAKVIERYSLHDDGNRLDLELVFIDPESFREPYIGQRTVLLSPGWELNEYVCEATTGEF